MFATICFIAFLAAISAPAVEKITADGLIC
jgi:hypothetical protein